MIDTFQRLALFMRLFRFVAVGASVLFFITAAGIILLSDSREIDRVLVPAVLGLLWSLSVYAFIVNFQTVPEKANRSDRFFHRLKRRIHRGWYGFLAILFTGTTLAVVILTIRLVSIWLRE